MREIKFRASGELGLKKGMFDNVHVLDGKPYEWEPGDYMENLCEIEDGILMQFTGLRDSKGREVYEEDILEFRDGDRKIVKFKDGAFNPIPIEPCNEGHNLGYMYKWGLVIGNIYENPELLSDGDEDEV